MKLPAGVDVGVATHTGLVRSANEDDYLVVALPPPAGGLLLAVADGMGGVAGGGEASRAALRGLAASLLQSGGEPQARLAAGYAAASEAVRQLAQEVAALRDMGTTLTAVLLQDDGEALGHIGDSRALRLRGGELLQLTEDHALRQPHNYLTRCIGGGQQGEVPDLLPLPLQAGDRLVLLTDGVWNPVAPAALLAALQLPAPAAAAAALVQAALRAGGPDNATALVLDWRPGLPARSVELPAAEALRAEGLARCGQRLPAGRWPWLLLLLLSLLAATAALLRWSGSFDVFAWFAAERR